MIKIDFVSKSYGKIKAIENISFDIMPNDIVGFIGPNGSGKSTTMNILTGCLASDSGKVEINGFDIMDNDLEAKRHIGYLPEHPPLYPTFTVYEYLICVCKMKKIQMDRRKHTDEIMDIVGLMSVKNRRIGNLSKGFCQRIGLAQALIGYPSFLVFDEPTVGLDPKQKAEMLKLIKKLGTDREIILSSHILSEIDSVCNKLLIINNGHIVSNGNKDEVISKTPSYGMIQYEYKINGRAEQIKEIFDNMDGVLKVRRCIQISQQHTYAVLNIKDEPTAEMIFYTMAKNKMPIIMMKSSADDIESIFLKLTGDKK